MEDKEIIKELYIKITEASINKDIETLNKILANDYVLIHMTGKRQSKQDYINSVLMGELKYYKAIHESIDIKVDNNKATMVGKSKILASPFGIEKSWWNLKQDIKLEKENDVWLIKESKASSY